MSFGPANSVKALRKVMIGRQAQNMWGSDMKGCHCFCFPNVFSSERIHNGVWIMLYESQNVWMGD